jgi:hypothetical protein
MLRLRKIPWASLGMIVLTYGVFGWLMSASLISPWLPWFGTFYIMLVIIVLTLLPLRNLQKKLDYWLQSKLRSLITLILGAFAVVVIFSWIELFMRILVLIASALLVRIDLIAKGLSKGQIFLVLLTFGLGSYGLGVLIHEQLAIAKQTETTFLWY